MMAKINGTAGDDLLIGTSGNDSINANGGNDTINAGAGNDTVNAGDGNDMIDAGAGSDTVNAGNGNDIVMHNITQNIGFSDNYTGGGGDDTLQLFVTTAQYNAILSSTILQDFAVVAGSGAKFDFGKYHLGFDFKLVVQSFEHLVLNVVNHPPVAVNDAANASEDGPAILINVLANDTDPDAGDTKTLVSVTPSAAGITPTLVSGQIQYDPTGHFESLGAGVTATDTFTYTMQDSAGAQSTATATVTITGVNDAPHAVNDVANASEDGPAILINVLANDTDPDAGDTKAIVSASISAANIIPTISNGQIQYNPTGHFESLGAGQTTTDTFAYSMKDAAGAQSTATVTVTITGVNDAPTAVNDVANTSEDGPAILINVLGNDTDPDTGDTKTILSVTPSAAGITPTIVSGQIQYDPTGHFESLRAGVTATDTFTYTMQDSAGAQSTATVTVTITGVNDAPHAVNDVANASEDGPAITINVLANDTDPDVGDTKTLVSLTPSVDGVIPTFAKGGGILYNPTGHFESLGAGQTAQDTFTYTMRDAAGAQSTATVTVTITGVNDAPHAVNDVANVSEDGPAILINVLANDTDPDAGDAKTIVSVASSAAGITPTIVSGQIQYDPTGHFESLGAGVTATDTFTYTMKDSANITSTATVTVTITGVNDAPHAVNDIANASEDGPAILIDVLANDTDPDAGDTKTIVPLSLSTPTAGGTVSIVSNQVQYDPGTAFNYLNAGETATDTFTYIMQDSAGAQSTATVTVTIQGADENNNPPVAVNDSASVSESRTPSGAVDLMGNVLTNDSDADPSDTLVVTTTDLMVGAYGSLVIQAGGIYNYSFNDISSEALSAGEVVHDIFIYSISDGQGGTASANLDITITGTNDLPVVAPIPNQFVSEDIVKVIDVTFTDVDHLDTHTLVVSRLPGTLDYGTMTSSITQDTTNIPGPLALPSGTVHLVYDPTGNANAQALSAGESVTIPNYYQVKVINSGIGVNDSKTFTMTITGVNDAPVASVVGQSTDEDTVKAFDVNFTDVDHLDAHTVSAVRTSGIAYGTLTTVISLDTTNVPGPLALSNGTIHFVYDPSADPNAQALSAGQTATDSFNYTVNDGHGGLDTQSVIMTIIGVNDAAIISGISTGSVTEDVNSLATGLLNIADPDTGQASFQTATAVVLSYGSYDLLADGSWSYHLNNFLPAVQNLNTGNTIFDQFTATSLDGSSSQVVTITIHGTDDFLNNPPTAFDDSLSNIFDPILSTPLNMGNVLTNDQDADSGDKALLQVASASNLVITQLSAAYLAVGSLNITTQALAPGEAAHFIITPTGYFDNTHIFNPLANDTPAELIIAVDGSVTLIKNDTFDFFFPGQTIRFDFDYSVADPHNATDVGHAFFRILGSDNNDLYVYTSPVNSGADIGNDILLGSSGDDILGGGAGRDILEGRLGNDALVGGTDVDTFVFNMKMEGGLLGITGNDADVIRDFVSILGVVDNDKLSFTGVFDANGDQSITEADLDFGTVFNSSTNVGGGSGNDTVVTFAGGGVLTFFDVLPFSSFTALEAVDGAVNNILLNGV